MIYHRKHMIEAIDTVYLLHFWYEDKHGEYPPYGLRTATHGDFKTLRSAVNSPYSNIAKEQS